MLDREINKEIKKWIRSSTKALLLTGARQVGKTYSIVENLEETKQDFVILDFVESPELVDLFLDTNDASVILERLEFVSDFKLTPGKTIIFFDEIQECPEILDAVKQLVKDETYRYILSGSAIGISLDDIKAATSTYITTLEMFPLTLREFYHAIGFTEDMLSRIEFCFKNFYLVDEFIHKKMMEAFVKYLVVGGMPEAVQSYVDNKDLSEVRKIQSSIIEFYKINFAKFESGNKLHLTEIFEAIPNELSKQNKRFYINMFGEGERYNKYRNSFMWLNEAKATLAVTNASEPIWPLKDSENENLFKLFMCDVGLLTCSFIEELNDEVLTSDAILNNNALFESAVAQDLIARNKNLHYYNNKKLGEVNFLMENRRSVLPIEVKTGKRIKKHSALNNLLLTENFKISKSYVFYNGNIQAFELEEGQKSSHKLIQYYPIYMTMFL